MKAKLTYVGGEMKMGKVVRGSGPHDTEPVLIESRRADRPGSPDRTCKRLPATRIVGVVLPFHQSPLRLLAITPPLLERRRHIATFRSPRI